MDAVHPCDFLPAFYQTGGKKNRRAYFLVRNCGSALLQLCQQKLLVANPNKFQAPFELTLILGYSHISTLQVNVQDNIIEVLKKRLDPRTKVLNLENFYSDPDLSEFCILSQPKLLTFVLHLSKSLQYNTLKLNNNGIHVLNPISAIWGSNVTSLDLRNNMIESLAEVDSLKQLQLTELWLDGNPLCDKYDELTYIKGIKEICPKMEKLDGLCISGFAAFRRNYLCDNKAINLVDQFIEHFFTLYDGGNRNVLEGLYDSKAMFSLIAYYIPGQISSHSAELKKYIVISRNLKTMADITMSNVFLYVGNKVIIKFLSSLPGTQHDPLTFTVDLVSHNDKLSILTVSGVFKEPAESLLAAERMLGFSRTFVLKAGPNREYKILNDMLLVTNVTSSRQRCAFKLNKVPRSNYVSLPAARTEKEMIEMAEAFQQITNLTLYWSKRCLQEYEYDLKKSLKLFVDLYKANKFPKEAFNDVK